MYSCNSYYLGSVFNSVFYSIACIDSATILIKTTFKGLCFTPPSPLITLIILPAHAVERHVWQHTMCYRTDSKVLLILDHINLAARQAYLLPPILDFYIYIHIHIHIHVYVHVAPCLYRKGGNCGFSGAA